MDEGTSDQRPATRVQGPVPGIRCSSLKAKRPKISIGFEESKQAQSAEAAPKSAEGYRSLLQSLRFQGSMEVGTWSLELGTRKWEPSAKEQTGHTMSFEGVGVA